MTSLLQSGHQYVIFLIVPIHLLTLFHLLPFIQDVHGIHYVILIKFKLCCEPQVRFCFFKERYLFHVGAIVTLGPFLASK